MRKRLLTMATAICMMLAMSVTSVWAAAPSYKTAMSETASYLEANTNAVYGNETVIIALARGDLGSEKYMADYKASVEKMLADPGTKLDHGTTISGLIGAVNAMGGDATDVAGVNLVEQLSKFKFNGINSIWTSPLFLKGYNTKGYTPISADPEDPITIEKIVDGLLTLQEADGAWGGTDWGIDGTAMTLQPLAPHCASDSAVKEACDKAVTLLSQKQQSNGAYLTNNGGWVESSESASQVIIALTALGIDPNTDSRFVKGGRGLVDVLMSYHSAGGGFKSNSKAGSAVNVTASVQALTALVAYDRFVNGKAALYDMTDAVNEPEDKPVAPEDKPQTPPADTDGKTGDKTDGGKTNSPQTGDESPLAPLAILIAVSGAAAMTLAYKRREER